MVTTIREHERRVTSERKSRPRVVVKTHMCMARAYKLGATFQATGGEQCEAK